MRVPCTICNSRNQENKAKSSLGKKKKKNKIIGIARNAHQLQTLLRTFQAADGAGMYEMAGLGMGAMIFGFENVSSSGALGF